MKRPLNLLTILLTLSLAGAVSAQEQKYAPSAGQSQASTLPVPAGEGGYFERGGADIGRGYGYGGRELGRNTAEFGRQFGRGEMGTAWRAFGRGFGEFGRGVGVGTGRAFKNFGLAFRNWGRKIDPSASDDQKNSEDRRP
jgi:hypothetical protein